MLKGRKRRAFFSGALLALLLMLFIAPIGAVFCLSLGIGLKDAGVFLEQYAELFASGMLKTRLLNSCVISMGALAVQLPLSLSCAAALSRLRSWLTRAYIGLLLIMLLMPFQTYMLPVFRLYRQYGLYDTRAGIMLHAAFSPLGPLTVWCFLRAVPEEQWEAASLDTSSVLVTLTQVILPQLLPMLAALFLLSFAEVWNTVEPALVLLRTEELKPASLSLNDLGRVSWAAAAIYCAPVVALCVPTVLRLRSRFAD